MTQIQDYVRQARDAETAHVEAVLKLNGAKYLRLARLHDVLRERGYGKNGFFELRVAPGTEPQLWLDLGHRVTMEPDASTYRLTDYKPDVIVTVEETTSRDAIVGACTKVLAHHIVRSARVDVPAPDRGPLDLASKRATLVYVWLTGVLTGVVALTIYAIFLKKLPF